MWELDGCEVPLGVGFWGRRGPQNVPDALDLALVHAG